MKLSQHWSKGTAEDCDRHGKPVTYSCWRSSDVSAEDARETAVAAARRILSDLLAGRPLKRYGYGDAPLREDVLQKFENQRGELIAAVTVNAYGCLVLNTARVMFVDIDFPPVSPGEAIRNFFARLIGKKALTPESRREATARAALEAFLAVRSDWGIRAYRTCAGMRVMVTHDLFDPAGDAAKAAFAELSADPLYIRLCEAQQSFRARLTPKPWRCGHRANPIRWPRETPAAQAAFEKWQAKYAARQSGYATCRFVEAFGHDRVHPDVQRVLDVHDEISRASEPLALA